MSNQPKQPTADDGKSGLPENVGKQTENPANAATTISNQADATISYRKIPHGLTYKHETRHHESHRRHSTSPKRASAMVELKRHPLTCVKDSNYRKLDVVGAKHDLTTILVTVDKENGDTPDAQAQDASAQDSDSHDSKSKESDGTQELNKFTGPLSALCPVPSLEAVDNDDVDSSPVNCHQIRVVQKKRSAPGDGSPRRGKRRESAAKKGRHTKGLARQSLAAKLVPGDGPYRTPVRKEADVKSAPRRAHHNRIIEKAAAGDEALDPGNSPLAAVSKGDMLDEKIEGETEVIRQLRETAKDDIHHISDEMDVDMDLTMSPVRIHGGKISRGTKSSADSDASPQKTQRSPIKDTKNLHTPAPSDDAIFTEKQMQEVKNVFAASSKSMLQTIDSQNTRIDNLQGQLSACQAVVSKLTGRAAALAGEKSRLTASLKSAKIESESASSLADKKLGAMGLKLKLLEKRCNGASARADSTEARLKKAEARAEKAEAQTGKASERASKATAQIRQLEARLKSAESSLDEERKGHKQADESVSEMRAKIAKSAARESDMRSTLEVKRAEVKSLEEEKAENEATIRELKAANDASDAAAKRASARLNATKEKLETIREEKEKEDRQLAEVRSELEKTRDELEKARKEAGKAGENAADLKAAQEQAVELKKLQGELAKAQEKIAGNEKNLEDQLEKLAQDLYLQYSAKHEQKVATLKRGYEMKWAGKVKRFTKENESLKHQISAMKKRLEVETSEKKQLVKLWDEYVKLEKKKD